MWPYLSKLQNADVSEFLNMNKLFVKFFNFHKFCTMFTNCFRISKDAELRSMSPIYFSVSINFRQNLHFHYIYESFSYFERLKLCAYGTKICLFFRARGGAGERRGDKSFDSVLITLIFSNKI